MQEGRARGRVAGATLHAFHTHLAAADPGVELSGFQRLRYRLAFIIFSLIQLIKTCLYFPYQIPRYLRADSFILPPEEAVWPNGLDPGLRSSVIMDKSFSAFI